MIPSLSLFVRDAITTLEGVGIDDEIMMGKLIESMMAGCHLNPGLNAANHGYPRSRFSVPMSVIRNHMSLTTPLVWTFKSMKWVILPNLFSVWSMLNILFGFSKACAPTFIRSASCGCMKQSTCWLRMMCLYPSVCHSTTATAAVAAHAHVDDMLVVSYNPAEAARFRTECLESTLVVIGGDDCTSLFSLWELGPLHQNLNLCLIILLCVRDFDIMSLDFKSHWVMMSRHWVSCQMNFKWNCQNYANNIVNNIHDIFWM